MGSKNIPGTSLTLFVPTDSKEHDVIEVLEHISNYDFADIFLYHRNINYNCNIWNGKAFVQLTSSRESIAG